MDTNGHIGIRRKELLEAGRAIHDAVQEKLHKSLVAEAKALIERERLDLAGSLFKALDERLDKGLQSHAAEMKELLATYLNGVEAKLPARMGEALDKRLGESVASEVARQVEIATKDFDSYNSAREQFFRKQMEDQRAAHNEQTAFLMRSVEETMARMAALVDRINVPPSPPAVVQVTMPEQSPPVVNVTAPPSIPAPVDVQVVIPEAAVKLVMPPRTKEFEYYPDGRPSRTVERDME